MKHWAAIIRWEVKMLLRGGQCWLLCGALLVSAGIALWAGARKLERQRAEMAVLPAHYEEQMRGLARRFSPEGEAGYVAYYTFFPTQRHLPPLAGFSVGLRDVVPAVLWVRLLGIEGQLYEADLGNPTVLALGNFDLAFVFAALAPLVLLVLCHDALTRERESGRMSLLLTQTASPGVLLAVRVGLRWVAVALTCCAAWLAGCLLLSVPLDAAALGWFGVALAGLFCWAGVAALVAVTCRSVASSLALAIGGWVVAVVLLPAGLNLGVATVLPVDEGLSLTVKQRQASHSAWDRPRAETMDKFFVNNPDWSGTPPVTGRFAWRWYYAMHEVADDSVAAEAAAYRSNLLQRQVWHTRLAWLAPSAYTQLALDRRADSDLDAHLAYLNQVRAFHRELRGYFYPLCFAEQMLKPAEFRSFPRYLPAPVPPAQPVSPLPLLIIGVLSGALTCHSVRRLTLV